MMKPRHWEVFQKVLAFEGQRRGLQEPKDLIPLIPQLWETLRDEQASFKEANKAEIEGLKNSLMQSEDAIEKIKARIGELEKESGETGSSDPRTGK